MANRINFQIGYEINKTKLEELKSSLKSLQGLTQSELLDINRGMSLNEAKANLASIRQSARELNKALSNSFNSDLGVLNVVKFNNELKKLNLKEVYNNLSKAGNAGQAAFRDIATQALTTNKQLKQTNKIVDSMARTFKNNVEWTLANTAINTVTGSIGKAYGFIKNLDRSLNDIRIVTRKSADDMSKFAVEANKAAQALGKKTTDYTDSSLIFYQQGLADEEVKTRTDITLKTANVTQQSAAEISELLTAIWNGYKVSADEAETYIDKVAAVAAGTASDLEELSKGMSKVASAANIMGVDVDQLNAQLSTIISVTRESPESVGTALKSVYSRMSGIEKGEDEEYDLKSYAAAMKDLGTNVLDSENNLRDMGEVIEEIGGKWKTMDREAQVALAQAVGGTYQYARVLALFDNWDEYNRALELSKNSTGELQRQQDVYMESTQAHLAQLTAASEELYSEFLDPDTVISFTDALTKGLKILTSFVDSIGGGSKALLLLGTTATKVFSQQIAKGIGSSLSNMRKMKENADTIKAQMEIMEMFKDQKIDDEALNQLVRMREQIISYGDLVTASQNEQANAIIKTTNDLKNQEKQWDETLQKFDEYAAKHDEELKNSTVRGVTVDDATRHERYSAMLEEVKNSASSTIDIEEIYEANLSQFIEGRNVDAIRQRLGELNSISNNLNNADISELNETQLDKLIEKIDKVKEEIENTKKELEEASAKEIEDLYELSDSVEEYINKIEDLQNQNEGLFSKDQENRLKDAVKKYRENGSSDDSLNIDEASENLVSVFREVMSEIQAEADAMGEILDQEANGASEQARQNVEEIEGTWNNFVQGFSTEQLVQGFTMFSSAIAQGIIGVQTLLSLNETWENQDLTYGEKVNETIEKITASLLILIPNIKAAKDGLVSLASGFGLASAETAGFGTVLKTVFSGGLGLLKKFFPVIAVISAIIGGLTIVYRKVTETQRAAEEAAKQAEKSAKTFNDAQQAYEDFLSASDDYKSAVDAIKELDENTQEYIEALKDANEKAEALIENNKELRKYAYRDANGLIQFQEGAQKEIGNDLSNTLTASEVKKFSDEIISQESSYKANIGNYAGNVGEYVNSQGKTLSEIIKDLGKTFSDFGVTRSDYLNDMDNISEAIITQLSDLGDIDTSFKFERIPDEVIDDLAKIYRENNNSLAIEDLDNMKNMSDELKQSIMNNYENGILPLIQSNNELRDTIKYNSGKIAENKFNKPGVSKLYEEGSQAIKNIMNAVGATFSDSKQYSDAKKQAEKDVSELYNFFDMSKLLDKYESEFGVELVKSGFRSATFTTDSTNPDASFELSRDEIVKAIVEALTQAKVLGKGSSFVSDAEDIATSIEALSKSLTAGLGIDSEKLLSELQELFTAGDTGFSEDFLITEEQKQTLIENIKELPLEALADVDWTGAYQNSAKEYINSLEAAIQNLDMSDLNKKMGENYLILEEQLRDYMGKIQSGDYAAGKLNKEEKEEIDALLKALPELASKYPELETAVDTLNDTQMAGTQKYLEALELVEDKLFDITHETLSANLNESIDDALEFLKDKDYNIEIGADTEKFEAMMAEILSADYEISVHLYAEGLSEFESVDAAFTNIYEKAAKIGESFIVAGNDIRELNNTFPGIIEGMTYLADGTIQLNKQIAQSAMDAAKEEAAADATAAVNKMETAALLLEKKRDIYMKMSQAAAKMSSGEVTSASDSVKQQEIISQGLKDLKETNAKITATNVMNNDKEVADGSLENGEVVFKNWNEAWTKSTEASAEWARTAIEQMCQVRAEAAQEGAAGDISEGNFDINYSGATVVSKEATVLDDTQKMLSNAEQMTRKDWGKIAETYRNYADSYGSMANDLRGSIAQLGARAYEVGHAFDNVSQGYGVQNPNIEVPKEETEKEETPKEPKDPDFIDYLEEERDRYHEINIELDKRERKLSRLQRLQDGLFGKQLLNNLNKQLTALKEQNNAYERKISLAKSERNQLKGTLVSQGVRFGKDGQIENYNAALDAQMAYVNSVISQYNSMTAEEQEGFKDVVETAKKNYEDFKNKMEKYEELVNSTIPDLKDQIQDNLTKEIEINIKKFNMEVEIRLNMGQAFRDSLEFKKNIIKGLTEEDIVPAAKIDLDKYKTFYDRRGTGEIQVLTNKVLRDKEEIYRINKSSYGSEVFGKQRATAIDTLRQDTDSLMKALEELKEVEKDIREAYPKLIDQMSEAFDKQVKNYEFIGDLLEHDKNLIGLLYGDKAYSEMDTYYRKIEQNNNKQLDFLKRRADYAKRMMESETDPEAREKWEEEWKESLSSLNSLVEDAINNIKDKYANSINQVMDEWEKGLTDGLLLDDLADEWDLINRNSEFYLDNINSIYDVEKLRSRYIEAINNTDGLKTQKDLSKLMEQQIGYLKEKENLTQYDIDQANKIFEIAQKEAALREAQQNKSKMRLRRNSQGNYEYQYVADNDDIEKRTQELLDLQNALYNFNFQAYQENNNKILDLQRELSSKIKDIYTDENLDREEKLDKIRETTQYYEELMAKYVEKNETIKTNLKQATFVALQGEYQADEELFKGMVDIEYEQFETLTEDCKTFFLDMVNKNVEELERMNTEQDRIVNSGIVPNWNNAIQSMINKFSGPDGLGPQVDMVIKNLDNVTKNYEGSIKNLEKSAGVSFNSIKNGYDQNATAANNLLQKNQSLINEYAKQVTSIKNVISELDKLINKYKDVYDAAIKAVRAGNGTYQYQNSLAADAAARNQNTGSRNPNIAIAEENLNAGAQMSAAEIAALNAAQRAQRQSSSGGGSRSPSVGQTVTYIGGAYYSSSYGDGPTGNRGPGGRVVVTQINSGAPYPYHVQSSNSAFGWLKKSQLSGYDTGGYTGAWGNEGKIAMLHEKELVLNKEDTGNILQAVNIVRDMQGLLSNITNSVLDRMSGLAAGLSSFSFGSVNKDNTVEQKVEIKADFPNVTNSKEIENAFSNLVNVASQYAFNTKR